MQLKKERENKGKIDVEKLLEKNMNAHRTVSEEIRWSNSQSGSIQSNSLRDQSLQWNNVDHRLMAIKECEEEEDKRDSQQ